MESVDLKTLKKKFDLNRKSFRYFISRIEKNPPKDLHEILDKTGKEVWSEVSCLSCANCCKVMSPTYTTEDIKRISAHLGMKAKDFKEKWLYRDKRNNEWMNK